MDKFGYQTLEVLDLGGKRIWFFDCAMVSACPHVFGDCESNYEVEAILREAGVIKPGHLTDTESCALVLNFNTREEGVSFLRNLNNYLKENVK